MAFNLKVSIVILCWNGLKDTVECLESIRKSDYPNCETIVIDNGSTDNSADTIGRLFQEVTLLRNKHNLGFAGGSNTGIKYAMRNGADYIWLLNSDTVVEPNTLSELVKEGEKSSKTGLLSPIIFYYNTPDKIQFCGSYFDFDNFRIHHFKNLTDAQQNVNKNIALWGTALLIKRAAVEKIGFLNDKLFAYYEDSDYSLRALKKGFLNKIVFSARILHKSHSIDVGGIKEEPVYFFYYMTRNEYRVWMSALTFVKRLIFFRKYLARVMRIIGNLKDIREYEKLEAVADGLYCGLQYRGGKWNENVKMPVAIKKFISWHPYFFANLLEFNIKNDKNL